MFIFTYFHPVTLKLASSPLRQFLFALAIIVAGPLFCNQAQAALNCTAQPTCAELGYAKTVAADCPETDVLLCPFDKSFKKCVRFTQKSCAELGFTQENKSIWCGKLIYCEADKTYSACTAEKSIDCTAFTLSSCPTNANCSACDNRITIKYKIDTCKNGYIANENNTSCDEASCPTNTTTVKQGAAECGESGALGWTISKNPSGDYSGSSPCYKCNKNTCPIDYTVGPFFICTDGYWRVSNGYSGDKECLSECRTFADTESLPCCSGNNGGLITTLCKNCGPKQ